MADPTSTTVAGAALAAGAITITGSILGVHYDTLLAGLFGGLVSLSYLPPMSLWRSAGSVLTSALLAGFFSPVIAAAGANYFPWLATLGDHLRIAGAAFIGLSAQSLIPIMLAWARKQGGLQ